MSLLFLCCILCKHIYSTYFRTCSLHCSETSVPTPSPCSLHTPSAVLVENACLHLHTAAVGRHTAACRHDLLLKSVAVWIPILVLGKPFLPVPFLCLLCSQAGEIPFHVCGEEVCYLCGTARGHSGCGRPFLMICFLLPLFFWLTAQHLLFCVLDGYIACGTVLNCWRFCAPVHCAARVTGSAFLAGYGYLYITFFRCCWFYLLPHACLPLPTVCSRWFLYHHYLLVFLPEGAVTDS